MTLDRSFDPAFSRATYLETPGGGEALRRLEEGLGSREPFLLVTGEPGTGKTTLAREAIARWGSRVTAAFVAYPMPTASELLEEILLRFGAEPPAGAGRPKLVAAIERALAAHASPDQVAMLVVDDAHHLAGEQLEALRLLACAAQHAGQRLEVLLVGLPSLEARLAEPALDALHQRIAVRVRLEPLSASEVRHYLHHRLNAAGADGPALFPRKACREIASLARGVPREINTLAAEALRVARAWGDASVGLDHVQAAVAALSGAVPRRDRDEADEADAVEPRAASPATASRAAAAPPASAPPARPHASVPTPAPVAPVQASTPPSAPAAPRAAAQVAPTPAPAAPRAAAPAPAAPPDPSTATHHDDAPASPPPASHDAREWVARFVGDKGPLQIGSLAMAESALAAEPPEAGASDSRGGEEKPSRRRERSERGRGAPRSRHRRGGRGAMAAALAAVVVVGAVVVAMRGGVLTRGRAAQGAQAPAQVTQAPASPARSRAPRTTAPAAAETRPVVTSALAEAPRTAEAPARKSRGPYALDVGSAPDLESALGLRDRMQDLTGFEGWVVSEEKDGREHFRVVLGAYRSEARARAAADMLLTSRTLDDVTVVPLPPRSARQ